jgi:mono/diheme cytochrome c family protein
MTWRTGLQVVVLALSAAWVAAAAAQEEDAPPAGGRGRGSGRLNAGSFSPAAMIAGQMLSQGDNDQDQLLARDEFTRLADAWFDVLDPDGTGQVRQEEALRRFGELMPAPQGFGGRGGQGTSRFLGLFVALDRDSNRALSRQEVKAAFEEWFDGWDADGNALLDRAELVTGLNAALPRTNFGAGTSRASQERLAGLPEPPPSPVLPPQDAAKTMQLVGGFRVELAASEPMVEDPISLAFDEDGRLFVVEMRSFMIDIDRTDEDAPIGRISRLEDLDGDGCFDTSTVFVDGLILPRAVGVFRGGILYVSDYKLYFAQDTDGDGKADRIELIDPDYGRGNIEHAPNGLMLALDNWIYNARSQFRYRWFGDVLVKQRTENRGQWGITQDNYGRLFHNVNNSQLLGDYTLAKLHESQCEPSDVGRVESVYRHRPTGVQHPYEHRRQSRLSAGCPGPSGRLYVFASSCSPVIYRGDNFPDEFQGNAFVCDSAGNLVKRNLVFDDHLTLRSEFAYEGFEFLASTDERFRPVNLFNGPDGTLWLVDMYRGINQYGLFMTEYLRRETLERGLDQGVHLGRIYRIVSAAKKPAAFPRLSQESPEALVQLLSHANGWIRDTAQRLLVQRRDLSVTASLMDLVRSGPDPLGRIHALWTLEGLYADLPEGARLRDAHGAPQGGTLDAEPFAQRIHLLDAAPDLVLESPQLSDEVLDACLRAIRDADVKVQIAAIRVSELLTRSNALGQELLHQELAQLVTETTPELLFQMALTAGNLPKPASLPILDAIATRQSDELLIREAVMSGLEIWELPFLKRLLEHPEWQQPRPGGSELLQNLASAIMRERHPINVDELLSLVAAQEPDHLWRGHSLLAGIASSATGRFVRPVRLRRSPAALDALANARDPQLREQWSAVASHITWPGEPSGETIGEHLPEARPLTAGEQDLFATGKLVYQQVCAGCHGADGEGIRPLAAPLAGSDWVLGPEDRLIRILLHGLTGEIEVDGVVYRPPIVLPEMPSVSALDDGQIAGVLTYIRRAWGHTAEPVSVAQVAATRAAMTDRNVPWTPEELMEVQ